MFKTDDEGRDTQCTCCPDTNVRYFCGTPLCETCASETPFVCGECGGISHSSSANGPTTCCDCRAVECHKSVDWDEGDGPTGECAALTRQLRAALDEVERLEQEYQRAREAWREMRDPLNGDVMVPVMLLDAYFRRKDGK